MTQVVGVIFSPGGRVYSFDAAGLELAWNERVICQTARGQEFGRVVKANHELDRPATPPLKKVIRRATDVDRETLAANELEEERAMGVFRAALRRAELNLKPVAAELVFDGSRIVFTYQAEEKPDVAALQGELSASLRRRVELHSVGPRECARLCGDHGLCGTQHCCRRFPSHEQPITLRMAKDQDLLMSSSRITGLCGRLRCCLAYEHPMYKSFRDRAPRMGRRVETPQGVGVVKEYAVLRDACLVDLEDDAGRVEIGIDDCRELAKA
ncbi:MAG: hypothetical protein E6G67_04470 [Actinobacteria bacterium]|nr:MAG: hypothetical protein E6G67_04470 [Actinomycetota bacterium]